MPAAHVALWGAKARRRLAIAAPAPANLRLRTALTLAGLLVCFAIITGQLIRLALRAAPEIRVAMAEPMGRSWARPDIVDRHGRLLASDVGLPSLYADPQRILDLDEAVEKLAVALPGLDAAELRRALADRSRRFAWVARGLTPRQAQRVHELGLPGFAFRTELKRVYPQGALAGHLIGAVNVDNKGIAGLERLLDETGRVEPVQGAERSTKPELRLSLDIGVQHGLAQELKQACERYQAMAAAGLILDATSGEVIAAVSLPQVDPARPAEWLDPARADRLAGGVYELGSIFKTITIANALELGIADLDRIVDVRPGLTTGLHIIRDLHPLGRPLSVREIFLHSSNVGAGMLALETGAERQRAFLARLGLLEPMRTEAGPVAAPLLPKTWGKIETITIGFGHGLAVAPLQFAGALAALVNGGIKVTPTLIAREGSAEAVTRVLSAATSASLRQIMRLNVTNASGTGRRAEAEDYRVGGKTGTAEMPGRGGYQEKAVISSFVGAFPMDAPRYVTLVLLFEPQTGDAGGERITAGLNAAPTTARIVERLAPLLGVLPRLALRKTPGPASDPASEPRGPFDAPIPAQ